jgi:hypothetical protein
MWKRLLSWDGWSIELAILWVMLSIAFGILFNHTFRLVQEWLKRRRR